MNYCNTPGKLPSHVQYHTFFCECYHHELGYAVYLPADYESGGKSYPVHYHFHGWQGCELSDIAAMEPVFADGAAIFVFPNVSDELGDEKDLPVEEMLFDELIPLI